MKKLLITSWVLLNLMVLFPSCTKEHGTEWEPILTEGRKEQLELAADSVFMSSNAPGMIALISAEGELDYVIKRGVSNLATGEPMSPNYYFRIASNTKTFTGLAVLILADEGRINLDSSVAHYLPEYRIPNGDLITIRMLGNMTSGLYNYSDDEGLWRRLQESNYLETFPADTLLAIAFRHPVKFPPGARHDYCNTNTVLLGKVMEKVTRMSAKQVIEDRVIGPLKLKHTRWPETMFLFAPYIHGYTAEYGTLTEATNWNPSWGYTAGVMISTLTDMKIWAKAVAEGTLLSDRMRAERFAWVEGYGFCVIKAGDWIGHAGTIFGYNSHVLYNPTKKITLVILVNMDTGFPVEYFSMAFRKILNR